MLALRGLLLRAAGSNSGSSGGGDGPKRLGVTVWDALLGDSRASSSALSPGDYDALAELPVKGRKKNSGKKDDSKWGDRRNRRRVYSGGWTPKKRLSRPEMDKLRFLASVDKEKYTPKVLSTMFGISYEAVKRIMKSSYTPRSIGGRTQKNGRPTSGLESLTPHLRPRPTVESSNDDSDD